MFGGADILSTSLSANQISFFRQRCYWIPKNERESNRHEVTKKESEKKETQIKINRKGEKITACRNTIQHSAAEQADGRIVFATSIQ